MGVGSYRELLAYQKAYRPVLAIYRLTSSFPATVTDDVLIVSEQLEDGMQAAKLTKVGMAQKMETSRSQLDRVLAPTTRRSNWARLIPCQREESAPNRVQRVS